MIFNKYFCWVGTNYAGFSLCNTEKENMEDERVNSFKTRFWVHDWSCHVTIMGSAGVPNLFTFSLLIANLFTFHIIAIVYLL